MALKAFLNQKNPHGGSQDAAEVASGAKEHTDKVSQRAEDVRHANALPDRTVQAGKGSDVNPVQTASAAASVGPGLISSDRDTLKALAALQIRYGHAGEAVPYLLMIRKTNPDDMEAARLLSIALMKLKRWEEAEMVLAEMQESDAVDKSLFSFVALRKSIVAFKVRKFKEASAWLAKFRNIKRSEGS